MYYTPLTAALLTLPIMLAVAGGCGQVTGLSDDYQYDLEGGTTSVDGGGGGGTDGAAKTDAPTTAEGGTDSGVDPINKCSNSQSVKAGQRLNNYNGAPLCKSCLATSCCNDVETCAANADCNHVFSCKLDCTDKPAEQRTQCFKTCTVNGGPSPLYQTTIGACGPAACTKECGLN